jgi:hypothetical protein
MLQRIQTLWMALTTALVCVVIFMPAFYFSIAGAEFRLMVYGMEETTGQVLVLGGSEAAASLTTPTLSVCMTVLLALAALVPLVAIFFYKKRQLQLRLLAAEFILLLGSAGLIAWYIWFSRSLAGEFSDNYFFSFFPLLTVVALLTNWFAIRGVMRDEILVRAADRIR